MSHRQLAKVEAVARFLTHREYLFLRCLADFSNQEGSSAFPRRKTVVAATGATGRWTRKLEEHLSARGWLKRVIVGSGCKRRTFYHLAIPPASAFDERWLPAARRSRQMPLPFLDDACAKPSGKAVEVPTQPVDADPLEGDPQIPFGLRDPVLSGSREGSSRAARGGDPQNLDPKNVQKKERPTLARRHSPPRHPHTVDLERLQFASRNLKARLERDRQRAAARRGRR